MSVFSDATRILKKAEIRIGIGLDVYIWPEANDKAGLMLFPSPSESRRQNMANLVISSLREAGMVVCDPDSDWTGDIPYRLAEGDAELIIELLASP